MKTIIVVLMSWLVVIIQAGSGSANPTSSFAASLTGQQVVPAINSKARGEVVMTLSQDSRSLHYKLIVQDINDVTMAHLHLAPKGQNGPIVAWLYPSAPPAQPKSGHYSGTLAAGILTAARLTGPLSGEPLNALLGKIEAGEIYVNVHTVQHPAGEIRGQVVAE